MRVLLVSQSDLGGGAAIAAYRLHAGLRRVGADSTMLVAQKLSDDPTVLCRKSTMRSVLWRTRLKAAEKITHFQKPVNYNLHSINLFCDDIVKRINEHPADLVHLHWVGHEMLSVAALKRIRKPIVWTLHDMWAFSGAEHYATNGERRYIDGYTSGNRHPMDRGLDIDRWVWKRKIKQWQGIEFTIISPSAWLAAEARKSRLFRQSRVEVIPNGINTSRIKPVAKEFARDVLSLPQDKELVLFGAMDATSDSRKGFQYLKACIQRLAEQGQGGRIEMVVFGNSDSGHPIDIPLKTHYLGRLSGEQILSLLYSAVDLFVMTSVIDNLPNTVMEAMACGTPCVGFEVGGVPDMIEHLKTGFLVRPYDIDGLVSGILWLLESGERKKALGVSARKKAEAEYRDTVVAARHLNLYEEVLKQARPQTYHPHCYA